MAGVAKIRRYNSSIEIFAIAIVSEYVIRVHSKVWGQISRAFKDGAVILLTFRNITISEYVKLF